MATRLPVAQPQPDADLPLFSHPGKAPETKVAAVAGTVTAPVLFQPSFNPMSSVGHQLMKARQARELSIEDVAFETRIPHQRLRDMENDDLSNFANLTYAKGFLKLYSKFLHLDLSDYLDEFDTSAISAVTGHEYIQASSAVRILRAPTPAPDQAPSHRSTLAGIVALVAVLVTGGWIFVKSRTPSQITGSGPVSPAVAMPPAVPSPMAQGRLPAPPASPTLAKATRPHPEQAAANLPLIPASEVTNTAAPAEKVHRATVVDDEGNPVIPGRPAQL